MEGGEGRRGELEVEVVVEVRSNGALNFCSHHGWWAALEVASTSVGGHTSALRVKTQLLRDRDQGELPEIDEHWKRAGRKFSGTLEAQRLVVALRTLRIRGNCGVRANTTVMRP